MADAKSRALLAAGCLCSLALAACGRQGQDEMAWARSALERNAALEIVAVDQQSRTFTVRSKQSGELRMVRADQLVGGPDSPTSAGASAAAPAPSPAAAGAAPAASGGAADNAATAAASEASPPPVPAPAPEPKVFASRALQPGSQARPLPGQVLEAGPGYSIEAAAGTTAPAAAREPGGAGAAVELRREPIVCQGARLLHIDNLNLQFEGDAVSAEDGCEIHITNSRIRATGVGVLARAANVHIDNSLIEGETASIDASGGAQIYAASSRFRGLSRRLDTAAVHDLGGNVWN